jgi:mono/diheme cytochrome c family protein
MKRRYLAAVTIVAVAAGGTLLWRQWPTHNADPEDREQVALGGQVYEAHCASCHGARLEGQPNWRQRLPNGRLPAPPHDASGHTWHHPDGVLFDITKNGLAAHAPKGYESDMPGFAGKLSDEQIWAVLAYIKSEWPQEVRMRQAQITERAR